MMLPGTELQVLVATRPVDFRKQADTLAAFVQEALAADPYSGALYVFRAKRIDRVKLLWWDGAGICLLTKRLEGGAFRWPPVEDGVMRLTPGQLAALLEGTEWVRGDARAVERPRAAS
jgi:transposase